MVLMKKIHLREWLTDIDLYLKYFTKQEIDKALNSLKYDITLESLTTTVESVNPPNQLHEVLKENVLITIEKRLSYKHKSFSARVEGNVYRIKNDYQGLYTKDLFFTLLCNKFKWFNGFNTIGKNNFKLEINNTIFEIPKEVRKYSIDKLFKGVEFDITVSKWKVYKASYNDIYLETEFGSLYVPIKALFDNDYTLIEQRMNEYFSLFNKYNKEKLEESLKPLQSKEYQELKNHLTIKNNNNGTI